MPPSLKNIILAATLVGVVLAAARGVSALPKAMHEAAIGPLYAADQVLFEALKADF